MRIICSLLFVFTLILTGCNQPSVQTKYAHGNYGDIIVVMSNERWNSESGDIMQEVFHDYYQGVPMDETLFDLHQIEYKDFEKINRYHKNVIFQEIDPDVEVSTIRFIKNKYAQNQIFVHVIAKNQPEFVKLLDENREKLVQVFLDADRDRWHAQLIKYTNTAISQQLADKYEISLRIPKGYRLDVTRDNFAWISKDTQKHSMNILVYTYTLTDSSKLEVDYLIKMRNEILKDNVPGPSPGSYMITEVLHVFPSFRVIQQNNSPTGVLQGLWKVQNNFMGGGFISYTKIDEARGRVVTVEGFIYSPNEEMRDQMRQLEGVLHTFDLLK